jgi:hypothetical protein
MAQPKGQPYITEEKNPQGGKQTDTDLNDKGFPRSPGRLSEKAALQGCSGLAVQLLINYHLDRGSPSLPGLVFSLPQAHAKLLPYTAPAWSTRD